MSTARFNLIFEGKVEPDHDPADVRRTLEDLFEFDSAQQANLFSGQPVILGDSMDAATANSFSQALAGAGAATRLEAANDEMASETATDKRSSQRRSRATRRSHSRHTAIQPDRRETQTRRSQAVTTES